MKSVRGLMVGLVCGLLLVAGGCDAEPDRLLKQYIAHIENYADVLEDVKRKDDIPKARAKLGEINQQIGITKKFLAKVDLGSPQQVAALKKKYDPKIQAAEKRIDDELERLEKSLGLSAVGELVGMKYDISSPI
jgi:hypothetical protein